jgi:osmotically-inducible protein OsmY
MTKSKPLYAFVVVFLLSGFLPGCAVERKCGLEGCPGDTNITAKVQASIDQRPEIGVRVHVQTLDHVVYLNGFVSAGEMSDTAEEVARHTPGVTRVVNSIAVAH